MPEQHRPRVDPQAGPVRQADRMTGLPIGTRVERVGNGRRTRRGVVMPYEPEHSRGGFPVRFDDGFWEVLDASDVTVLVPPNGSDR